MSLSVFAACNLPAATANNEQASTGTVNDSLYQDGTYSPGTHYIGFTISDVVTWIDGGF